LLTECPSVGQTATQQVGHVHEVPQNFQCSWLIPMSWGGMVDPNNMPLP